MTTPSANTNGGVGGQQQNGGKDSSSATKVEAQQPGNDKMAKTAQKGTVENGSAAMQNGQKNSQSQKPCKILAPKKKVKKVKKYRLGLGVIQQPGYGKLDGFNPRVGLITGILQLVLSLEAVTLGALQFYFRSDSSDIVDALYVWPSVALCILCGIFGAWSYTRNTCAVFLYMIVSIFACLMSCMMFGLEVRSSMSLEKNCRSTTSTATTTTKMTTTSDMMTTMSSNMTEMSSNAMMTTIASDDNVTTTIPDTGTSSECQNYGLNMAIAVILAIIAFFEILISFVAALHSSKVMCSSSVHMKFVDECLSDDDDEEPPPNAGLPQIRRHKRNK
ncbi:uncharacterized protein [Diadema setosum]|uniref:uncharacterized protein n=1 Tax=Diadema setosum TaxID=31175 RepID=UPI003B3A5A37